MEIFGVEFDLIGMGSAGDGGSGINFFGVFVDVKLKGVMLGGEKIE